MRGKGREPKNHELNLRLAAYLKSIGKRHQELAEIMELSPSTVSRLLAGNKYLEEKPRFDPDGVVTPEQKEEIESLAFAWERKLVTRLNGMSDFLDGGYALKRVDVFCPPWSRRRGGGTTDVKWQKRLDRFSEQTADVMRSIISRARCAGFSWGSTVYPTVRGVGYLERPDRSEPLKAFAVAPEPIWPTGQEYSASRVVHLLNRLAEGEAEVTTLSAIPALIPATLSEVSEKGQPSDVDRFRGYLEAFPNYQKIFVKDVEHGEEKPPLFSRADTIITSVSVDHRPWVPLSRELKKLGFEPDILAQKYVGDIAGVLLPVNGDSQADDPKLETRWTGLKYSQLFESAQRAKNTSEDNGVVVVAIGKNKAKTVFAAVKRGLANRLIIDRDLADALDDKLPAP